MGKNIQVNEEIYTYVYLWNASQKLLSCSKSSDSRDVHLDISALLMAYLAFEAFVNFCGYILLPSLWENEREYFRKKPGPEIENKISELLTVLKDFDWKKGERPYQSISTLRSFRDSVVHGKVQTSSFTTDKKADGSHIEWNLSWFQHIDEQTMEQTISDVRAFCNSLLQEMRKHATHPQLRHQIFEGPVGHAEGRSIRTG